MITWTKSETREGLTRYTAPLQTLGLAVLDGPYGFTMTFHHPHGVILGSVHPGPLEAAQGEIVHLAATWLARELQALQQPPGTPP